jgi:hypothetical protein
MSQNTDDTLVGRVKDCIDPGSTFSPAVLEAMRLADLYSDIEPEEFHLPANDSFQTFRPLELNKMLAKVC